MADESDVQQFNRKHAMSEVVNWASDKREEEKDSIFKRYAFWGIVIFLVLFILTIWIVAIYSKSKTPKDSSSKQGGQGGQDEVNLTEETNEHSGYHSSAPARRSRSRRIHQSRGKEPRHVSSNSRRTKKRRDGNRLPLANQEVINSLSGAGSDY